MSFRNKKEAKEYYQKNRGRLKRQHKEWKDKTNYNKKYYKKNKEKMKKATKKWREEFPEKSKRTNGRYYQKNKKEFSKRSKEYRKKFPEKMKAQNTANRKVLRKSHCEICGSIENLNRHHWRYDKPLLVNTLCRPCHQIQHLNYLRGA